MLHPPCRFSCCYNFSRPCRTLCLQGQGLAWTPIATGTELRRSRSRMVLGQPHEESVRRIVQPFRFPVVVSEVVRFLQGLRATSHLVLGPCKRPSYFSYRDPWVLGAKLPQHFETVALSQRLRGSASKAALTLQDDARSQSQGFQSLLFNTHSISFHRLMIRPCSFHEVEYSR